MSSTEVTKIERPPPQYWSGRVQLKFVRLALITVPLSIVGGMGWFYWFVIRKNRLINEYEAKYRTKEGIQKTFERLNKLKVFRSTQPEEDD